MWEFMFFVFGLVFGVAGLLLFQAVRRGIAISWYEWLLGVIGVALLYLGVWHFFASLRELETAAGGLGLALLGVPGLVLLAVVWQLWRRRQAMS